MTSIVDLVVEHINTLWDPAIAPKPKIAALISMPIEKTVGESILVEQLSHRTEEINEIYTNEFDSVGIRIYTPKDDTRLMNFGDEIDRIFHNYPVGGFHRSEITETRDASERQRNSFMQIKTLQLTRLAVLRGEPIMGVAPADPSWRDPTYVTIADESSELANSVRHLNITEAEKHTPKIHDIASDRHTFNGALTLQSDLTIQGNLTIQGDQTVVNTAELHVEDNIVLLNKNETGAGVTLGQAGVEVERGSLVNTQILWDETNGKFVLKDTTGAKKDLDIGNLTMVDTKKLAYTASYVVFKEGATCYAKNGSTGAIDYSGADAATVIQAAINALSGGRTWKEKVVVKGTFTITDTIKLPSYTVLEIQGKLTLGNAVNKNMIENSDQIGGNTEIHILGGELDGNKAQQTVMTSGIYFKSVTRFVIETILIQSFSNCGIWVASCSDGAIQHNFLGGSDHNAILTETGTRIQIHENRIYDAGTDGIDIHGGDSNYVVSDNLINNASSFGIYLYGGVFSCIIANNLVTNSAYGILVYDDCIHNLIIGNHFTNISQIAMRLGGSNVAVNNIIRNPSIGADNTYNAVAFVNATKTVFRGNKYYHIASNKPKRLIWLESGNDIVIEGNDFREGEFTVERIGIYGGVTGTIIKRNFGHPSENCGTATFSGNDSTTQFTIPHGLTWVPLTAVVTPGSTDAKGAFHVIYDQTNIVVVYGTAPPGGTNNVILRWYAEK